MSDNFRKKYAEEVKAQQEFCQARRDYRATHDMLSIKLEEYRWLENNHAKPTPVEVRAFAEYAAAESGIPITNMHGHDFPNNLSTIADAKDGSKLFILSNADVRNPNVHHWTVVGWVPTEDNIPPVTFSHDELDVILIVDPRHANDFDPNMLRAFQKSRPGQELGDTQYYVINPMADDPAKRFATNRTTTRPYPNTSQAWNLNTDEITRKVLRLAQGK